VGALSEAATCSWPRAVLQISCSRESHQLWGILWNQRAVWGPKAIGKATQRKRLWNERIDEGGTDDDSRCGGDGVWDAKWGRGRNTAKGIFAGLGVLWQSTVPLWGEWKLCT
jgi:hypothetical protein